MNKIHLLILAAGLSSRMKSSDGDDKMSDSVISQANTRSKGFIEIQSGNPLIYYITVSYTHLTLPTILLV